MDSATTNVSFVTQSSSGDDTTVDPPLSFHALDQIEHDILRHVRLLSLWQIQPAADLCNLLDLEIPTTCFGRTALIYCNGVPAVELLEIVTPE